MPDTETNQNPLITWDELSVREKFMLLEHIEELREEARLAYVEARRLLAEKKETEASDKLKKELTRLEKAVATLNKTETAIRKSLGIISALSNAVQNSESE